MTIPTPYPPTPGAPASAAPDPVGPAVSTTNLVKIYGRGPTAVRALDGVNLAFGSGEFTAIMGPSGSGKSTLLHCLAGLDVASEGTAYLGGTDLAALSDDALTELRRDRVGFVFQAFNLLPTLTAADNITLPLELGGQRVDQQWYAELVELLHLRDRLGHRPAELSGGQQQRVALARALLTRPEVVFADEPTGNVDTRTGAEILAYLRRAVRELGQTVVMVTHDPGAAAYADRVLLIADGRVAGDLTAPDSDTLLDALRQLGV